MEINEINKNMIITVFNLNKYFNYFDMFPFLPSLLCLRCVLMPLSWMEYVDALLPVNSLSLTGKVYCGYVMSNLFLQKS